MNKINTFLLMSAMAICMAACAQNPNQEKKITKTQKDLSKYSKAVFAAGCFWHEEALYDGIKGVQEAISGYAGGDVDNPNYEMVLTGQTGHAESVMVYYDSTVVSYATLLKAYFEAQDPTSVNGQGADRGSQYRSIAFYNNDQQKQEIEDYIKQLNASGRYDQPIAVIVMPYTKFWNAEDYHQEYVINHPNSNYVQNVCVKEVKRFQKKFPKLIKPNHILE